MPPPLILPAQILPSTQASGDLGSLLQLLPSPLPEALMAADETAVAFGTAASVAALGAYGARHVKSLRPLAAAGIGLLSHPAVDVALMGIGPYMAARSIFQFFLNSPPEGQTLMGLLGVGLGMSFALHGQVVLQLLSYSDGFQAYQAQMRRWLDQGLNLKEARKRALVVGDAIRRLRRDPSTVYQQVRGELVPDRPVSAAQREDLALIREGNLWWPLFMYGCPLLAGLQTLPRLLGPAPFTLQTGLQMLLGISVTLAPLATLLLYRAARGDHLAGMGPALSQELPPESYAGLLKKTKKRLRRAVPPLTAREAAQVVVGAKETLRAVGETLEKASALPPLIVPASPPDVAPVIPRPGPTVDPLSQGPLLAPGLDFSAGNMGRHINAMGVEGMHQAFQRRVLTPLQVLDLFYQLQAVSSAAPFPRLYSKKLRRALEKLASQSTERYREGKPRSRLDGQLVAVKDLFLGVDGIMTGGSQTAWITGTGQSDVVRRLLELGAIPIPVGMVAGALGGSGQQAGHGIIPHPWLEGYDVAGSSSGTAYVVGHPEIPILIGIGTDTGGSVTAPAGVCGLVGIVGPRGWISTKNMIPYDTLLDRVGVIGRNWKDAQWLASRLAETGAGSSIRPRVVYLKKMLLPDFQTEASREGFKAYLDRLREAGVEVQELDERYDFLSTVPFDLYPIDSYIAAAVAHMNAGKNALGEPPRRILDENIRARMMKVRALLEADGDSFFEEARAHSDQYRRIALSLIPEDVVWASPSPAPVPVSYFRNGIQGPALDFHDLITMGKNRVPEWAQATIPLGLREGLPVGVVLTGALPAISTLLDGER